MSEARKRAYRYLLYRAMLDIGGGIAGSRFSLHPRRIWRGYLLARRSGDLANWLHNLALYSSREFKGFQEDWFGKGYKGFKSSHPDHWTDYKEEFEKELTRREEARLSRISKEI